MKPCKHLKNFSPTFPKTIDYCEECVKTGDGWVHLRVCQTCGKTLCCDSSKNQHASKHYKETGHNVVISAEPGERWAWCYKHSKIVDY